MPPTTAAAGVPDLMVLIFAQPGFALATSSVSDTVNSEPFGRIPMILPFGDSRIRIPLIGGGRVAVSSSGASGSGTVLKSLWMNSPIKSRGGEAGAFGLGTSCESFALSPTR